MKLEEQVCNLELSKKLKELGVPQESLFYWKVVGEAELYYGADSLAVHSLHKDNYCSAFTVAELGEMLPDYTRKLGNLEIGKCDTDHASMEKHKKGWWNISYWTWENKFTIPNNDIYLQQKSQFLQQADTEADARAKMFIWLIENKYLVLPVKE